jgi:hypothetical protein
VTEKLLISFDGSEDDPSAYATIHNPGILSFGLTRQIGRYGLTKRADAAGGLSGRLQGHRRDFLAMVRSYGVEVKVVPPDSR